MEEKTTTTQKSYWKLLKLADFIFHHLASSFLEQEKNSGGYNQTSGREKIGNRGSERKNERIEIKWERSILFVSILNLNVFYVGKQPANRTHKICMVAVSPMPAIERQNGEAMENC